MSPETMSNNNHPTVSVVIPTYNRAHLVARAIQSVIEQTLDDWELLLVDDGSTDDTQSVVNGFRESRMRYLRDEVNRGAQVARNTGIRESRGEYVAFLDSDDEWLPQYAESLLEAFLRDTVGDLGVVLCGGVIAEHPSGNVIKVVSPKPLRGWVYEDLLTRDYRGLKNTFMVKKSAIVFEPAFDESLRSSQDLDFLIRMAKISRFDFVPELLVRKYRHSGPQIQAGMNAILGKEQLLEKFETELRQRPKALRTHHLLLAWEYWKNGDKANTRRHISKARQASPWIQAPYFWLLSTSSGRKVIKKSSRLHKVLRRRFLRTSGARVRWGL